MNHAEGPVFSCAGSCSRTPQTPSGQYRPLERCRTQATIRTLQPIAAATGYSLIVDFRPLAKNGK